MGQLSENDGLVYKLIFCHNQYLFSLLQSCHSLFKLWSWWADTFVCLWPHCCIYRDWSKTVCINQVYSHLTLVSVKWLYYKKWRSGPGETSAPFLHWDKGHCPRCWMSFPLLKKYLQQHLLCVWDRAIYIVLVRNYGSKAKNDQNQSKECFLDCSLTHE